MAINNRLFNYRYTVNFRHGAHVTDKQLIVGSLIKIRLNLGALRLEFYVLIQNLKKRQHILL